MMRAAPRQRNARSSPAELGVGRQLRHRLELLEAGLQPGSAAGATDEALRASLGGGAGCRLLLCFADLQPGSGAACALDAMVLMGSAGRDPLLAVVGRGPAEAS